MSQYCLSEFCFGQARESSPTATPGGMSARRARRNVRKPRQDVRKASSPGKTSERHRAPARCPNAGRGRSGASQGPAKCPNWAPARCPNSRACPGPPKLVQQRGPGDASTPATGPASPSRWPAIPPAARAPPPFRWPGDSSACHPPASAANRPACRAGRRSAPARRPARRGRSPLPTAPTCRAGYWRSPDSARWRRPGRTRRTAMGRNLQGHRRAGSSREWPAGTAPSRPPPAGLRPPSAAARRLPSRSGPSAQRHDRRPAPVPARSRSPGGVGATASRLPMPAHCRREGLRR